MKQDNTEVTTIEVFITKDNLQKLQIIGHSKSNVKAIASLLLEQKLNSIKPSEDIERIFKNGY